jgi:hypothetical protein
MAAEKLYTFQYLAAGFAGSFEIVYPANMVCSLGMNPYVVAIGTYNPYAQATFLDTGFTEVADPNAPSLARRVEIQNNSSFYIWADINVLYDFV